VTGPFWRRHRIGSENATGPRRLASDKVFVEQEQQ
jgi:hypothetical protein